jgi:hypothetical protein
MLVLYLVVKSFNTCNKKDMVILLKHHSHIHGKGYQSVESKGSKIIKIFR